MNGIEFDQDKDRVRSALRKAFVMGQNYWADADSESFSRNKKARQTHDDFRAFVDSEASDIVDEVRAGAAPKSPPEPALSGVGNAGPDEPSEPMREHVEAFARKDGWTPDDGEGAFEFVQRTSYRQGWEDGRKEAIDPHRDAPSAEPSDIPCPQCGAASRPGYVRGVRCDACDGRGTVPAPSAGPSEPVEVYNPWRESLENCISGDNYLRASEYRSLIEELDDLYRLRAAPPALPEGAVEAMRGAVEALRGLSLFVGVYEGRTLDKPRAEAMLRKADAALRAQLAQIGGVR